MSFHSPSNPASANRATSSDHHVLADGSVKSGNWHRPGQTSRSMGLPEASLVNTFLVVPSRNAL